MAPLCGFGGGAQDDKLSRILSSTELAAAKSGKPITRKVVVIGDGACGKTSLLNVFVSGHFPEAYEPTVFENHVVSMDMDGIPLELALWDTAGQEDFAKLRSLSYTDTHVILLCFSVDNPTSLENVEHKWIEEIIELCPGVKVALVALKCDLRSDNSTIHRLAKAGQQPCEYEEGLAVARRIRASRYLECSAKHNRGVQECFEESAKCAVAVRQAKGGDGWDAGGSSTGCTVS